MPLGSPWEYHWTFDLFGAGSDEACMSLVSTDDVFQLTTPSGTFEQRPAGEQGLEIECPNGSIYGLENAAALLSCEISDLPGFSKAWGGDLLVLTLKGGPEDVSCSWNCQASPPG